MHVSNEIIQDQKDSKLKFGGSLFDLMTDFKALLEKFRLYFDFIDRLKEKHVQLVDTVLNYSVSEIKFRAMSGLCFN